MDSMPADLAQRQAAHQVALDLLQRDALGFGNEPEGEYQEQGIERGVQPERGRVADGVEQGQEGEADDHVGDPVGDRRAADAEIAAVERLDFRTQHPDQRAGRHREADDEHQQHGDGEQLLGIGADAEVHHGADHAHADRHHHEAGVEDRFAPEAVDEADGDERGQHVDQADDGREPQLRGGGVTHAFENARRVVHHHVHAGELLDGLQQDAEADRAAEMAVAEEQADAVLRRLELLLDVGDLGFDPVLVAAQTLQYAARFLHASAHQQPARTFRQRQHADQEQRAGNGDHAQHPAPAFAVAEGQVRQEGREDADGDHQLVDRDHRAAAFLRGYLRQIQRRRERAHADGQAQHQARADQHGSRRRRAAQYRADHEQDGGQDQRALAPQFGRQPAGAQCADGRAQHHAADDPLDGAVADLEVGLDELDGAGDHADVEAEHQPGEAASTQMMAVALRARCNSVALVVVMDGSRG